MQTHSSSPTVPAAPIPSGHDEWDGYEPADVREGDAARLRHEAREHPAQARRLRTAARAAMSGPLDTRDPIRALKLRIAANERTRLAQDCDRMVAARREVTP